MHPVPAFFDHQYGLRKARKPSIDYILPRLSCIEGDEFTTLPPYYEENPSDTPIFACKFAEINNFNNILALANEDGKVAVYDVENKQNKIGTQGHNNAVFDLTWLFQRLKIVTASGDYTSKLFDISQSGIVAERTFVGHMRSVKTVTYKKDDSSVFASGGRDGNIILWDTRSEASNFIGKCDKSIQNSHTSKVATPSRSKKKSVVLTPSQNKSVTGLVFQDSNTLISCGAGDGCIKVWDVRKNYTVNKRDPLPKYILRYPGKSTKNGFSSIILDKSGVKLYANCLDNNIYAYNILSYDQSPVMQYSGHQNNSFYIKSCVSYDGNYLISGSSDQIAYIWKINKSAPILKLTGHIAEVTCVAWRQNVDPLLITCSDDFSHKIWRLGDEHLSEDQERSLKGRVEIIPYAVELHKPYLKRCHPKPILSPAKQMIISCEYCSSQIKNFEDCDVCSSCNKRKGESLSSENKRQHTMFGPRKLFINSCSEKSTDENKEPLPIDNLPNFVLDGVAPHLNFSPPLKKEYDWLTKLRIEKNLKRKMTEEFSDDLDQLATKMMKLDSPTTKKIVKNSSSRSPLLRYFKVTNSSKCDSFSNFKNSLNSHFNNDSQKDILNE